MEGRAVAIVAAAGVLLRLIVIALAAPDFPDPDSYQSFADAIARAHDGAAFLAALGDEGALRAPLFPVFIAAMRSLTLAPVVPLVLLACLSTITTISVHNIALHLGGRRTALPAAIIAAVWPPSVEAAATLWSEHLYVPLVAAALGCLARREASPRWLVAAGVALGLAALTRSMPLFLLPLALLVLPRVPLALAFAAVVVPYIAFASFTAGRFVPIETEGTMGLYRSDPPGRVFMQPGSEAPGALDAARITWAQLSSDPVHFARVQTGRAVRVLTPSWWLPGETARRLGSAEPWLRAIAIAVVVPLLAASVLGWCRTRDRTLARLLVVWIALHVVLVPLSGNTGARYRSGIDPALILFGTIGIITFSAGSSRARRVTAIALARPGAVREDSRAGG